MLYTQVLLEVDNHYYRRGCRLKANSAFVCGCMLNLIYVLVVSLTYVRIVQFNVCECCAA